MQRSLSLLLVAALPVLVLSRAYAQEPGADSAPAADATPAASVTPVPRVAPHLLDDERPPQSPSPARRWYGWQTLLCDGLSLALLFGGAATQVGSLPVVGAFGLLLATPIVHGAHGNPAAYVSLGLRLVSTFALVFGFGELLGAALAENESRGSPGKALVYLGVAGLATTIALDAALFAWDRSPGKSMSARAGVRPWLDARGAGGLMLSGAL